MTEYLAFYAGYARRLTDWTNSVIRIETILLMALLLGGRKGALSFDPGSPPPLPEVSVQEMVERLRPNPPQDPIERAIEDRPWDRLFQVMDATGELRRHGLL